MATVKKGTLAKASEWWKHLKWNKKSFWHKERQLEKKDINKRVNETSN